MTDAPFACPMLLLIGPDLTTDGFYRLDDPTHSIVDPVRMEAYKRSADPVKAVGLALVHEADVYRTTGSRAAAECALKEMISLAQQGALTGKMSSGQAYYVQGWIAGAIAIAFLKIRETGLATPEQATLIGAWLERIGQVTRSWYDEHVTAGNNHLYWAGVEVAAIGVAANNRKDFDWGVATYENGVAQIKSDGTLPLEMDRGVRALHYHLYALAPLVLLAEFGEANGMDLYSAHNGAIHLLARTSIAGIADPSIFVAATGKQQEVEHPVTGDQIGWAPPYLRRFPDATLARYVKEAPGLSVFYLGGLAPD
jgi:poly(beta-D-mannuronate) lyase